MRRHGTPAWSGQATSRTRIGSTPMHPLPRAVLAGTGDTAAWRCRDTGLVWSRPLPSSVEVALAVVSDELAALSQSQPVRLVVHGSLALGGFHPVASDVDVLAIVDDAVSVPAHGWQSFGARLVSRSFPGRGLELSVVSAGAAADPRPPWPFLLHVTTGASTSKVVIGTARRGDPDLLMHYAVARAVGIVNGDAQLTDLIGAVDRTTVLRYLADELMWGEQHAGEAYVVLNAGRALRFLRDGALVSKLDGADAAIAAGVPTAIVERAVAVQHGRLLDRMPTEPARRLVRHARHLLLDAAT